MSAMVAVLVVCLGSMFLIQAIANAPAQEVKTEADVLAELMDEVYDGEVYPNEARLLSIMVAFLDRDGVNAVSLEIRPSLPFGERMTLLTGTPEGLRDGMVKTVLFMDDRGERMPYFVTMVVWKDA